MFPNPIENQFKPVEQSRHHAIRAYCSHVYNVHQGHGCAGAHFTAARDTRKNTSCQRNRANLKTVQTRDRKRYMIHQFQIPIFFQLISSYSYFSNKSFWHWLYAICESSKLVKISWKYLLWAEKIAFSDKTFPYPFIHSMIVTRNQDEW